MTDTRITIEGLAELQKVLGDSSLWKQPTEDFIKKSALTIERKAKETAPVDTGRYRASIQSEVKGLQGIIYSDVSYARFIEYGTRPHWPPVGALTPWYSRHGFSSEFPVRRAIGMRGTKALLVLTNALKNSASDIQRHFNDMGKAILARWRR